MKVDKLADAVTKELLAYSDEVAEKTKKVIDNVTQEVDSTIKSHVTFTNRTGKYLKAFKYKTLYEAKDNKRNVWYVKEPQWRLTQLLEYGHASPKGGRTRAFPHIKYGDDFARENLEKEIKEALK